MKNVLLLSCRSPFLDDSKIYAPMANLYLKSFINKHLSDVNVVLGDDDYDVTNLSWIEAYDIIGLSIMTPQRAEANKLLHALKKEYPNKLVIAGGPHCKYYLDDIAREPYDFVVPFDGERPLMQIISGEARSRIIKDIMSKGDIASAPRPDRTSEDAIKLLKSYHYKLGGVKATTMMTARGCPELCTFCEDARTTTKWSSLENISAELDDITALGFGGVYIFDDLFAIAQSKVKPIVEEISRRGMIFRCNGQAKYFTRDADEFAKLLAINGCVEIAFGFESGSQRILDNVQKRTTVVQNYLSVEYAKKWGIKVKAFLMLGLPGENYNSIAETEQFIKSSGIDDFQLAIYYP